MLTACTNQANEQPFFLVYQTDLCLTNSGATAESIGTYHRTLRFLRSQTYWARQSGNLKIPFIVCALGAHCVHMHMQ